MAGRLENSTGICLGKGGKAGTSPAGISRDRWQCSNLIGFGKSPALVPNLEKVSRMKTWYLSLSDRVFMLNATFKTLLDVPDCLPDAEGLDPDGIWFLWRRPTKLLSSTARSSHRLHGHSRLRLTLTV
jgi:hypothetical protein